ncbi:DnaD domain protein [Bacillus thuringiensis]|uniref:DnaD domain protein n=1 Tax=Bacillus thuringiensis serovar andalousiensis TaxID=257985 RepID=A0A6H0TRR8_BACTU|nr:DnaD domain protein [Bacillus thuringiensis]QIW22438.1 DnaD domain protein [Bacillus thuringiensis serovar andalousiensis]
MGIFRVKKDANYSVIHNTPLRDENLSWRAKGLLAYMLSLPDDWTFHANELSQHAKDSEKITASIIKELKAAGYLKRYPVQNPETGKISHWETVVYEVPTIDTENHSMEKPPSGKTTDWKTTERENHSMEKCQLLNTNHLLSTNKLNTNIQNTNHHDDNDQLESHVLVDEEFKISYNFLKGKGIPLSEIAITELGEFCDLFSSELIKHATNKSIDENAPKWNYIKAILKSWEKQKLKTLDDVAALDRRFEMSKNNKFNRSGIGQSNRKEIVPDWLREDAEPTKKEIERQNSQSTDEECKRLQEVLKQYKK